MEGSKASFAAKGHIPQAAMALVEVFGIYQTDHFHMFVWEEES